MPETCAIIRTGNSTRRHRRTRRSFATYYRDSTTGLDYAQNRYYSSTLGRFLTAYPAIGSVGMNNPQSWNRYSYVIDDPVNSQDPQGLCSVIVGGITQAANTDGTNAQQEFANEVGAISAFPYAGGTIPGDVYDIVKQGLGLPTGATLTALEAIALAAKNPGSISIFAFSGGAAAFTSAWNYLTPDVQNRIDDITYIDPGSAQSLQGGNGATVNVYYDGTGFLNNAIQFVGGKVPLGAKFHDTGKCGHNANCVFKEFADSLSQTATYCPMGAGGVFGAPRRTSGAFAPNPFGWFYWYSWEIPQTPSVTSTISYYVP